MLPSLNKLNTKTRVISAFKGLCARSHVPDGYFESLENTTSDHYPALTVRSRRGLAYNNPNMHGMHAHDKMCWAQHEDLYYDSECVGSVTNTDKQFVSMGAYIVIFPDKLMLDTRTGELINMERVVRVNGAVLSICDIDGVSATASPYMKIESEGVGAGFKKGDQVEISGFTTGDFDASYIIRARGDNYIVVLNVLDATLVETGALRVERRVPDLDFVCALNNRVWGCSSEKHEVYACKLGDPTNWHVFEGISTDSYAATVVTPGAFTGACAFAGTVLFFKEHEIIKLFGTKPSNFQLSISKSRGVERGSSRSLCVVDELLYYKGVDGILTYDGGVPTLISAALGATRYDSACGGALNGKYYVSMRNASDDTWAVYVYDSMLGVWNVEQCYPPKYMQAYDGSLYMLTAADSIENFAGRRGWYEGELIEEGHQMGVEPPVGWHAQTGPLATALPHKRTLTKLFIRYSTEPSAQFTVYLRYGAGGEWERAASVTGPVSASTVSVPIAPRRADCVYVKLSGYGVSVIYSIMLTTETGSDI